MQMSRKHKIRYFYYSFTPETRWMDYWNGLGEDIHYYNLMIPEDEGDDFEEFMDVNCPDASTYMDPWPALGVIYIMIRFIDEKEFVACRLRWSEYECRDAD